MGISTYTELQTAVTDWSHRSVSQAVDFITLAEKRINTLLASRLSEVDASLVATIGSRYITLPSGFISPYAMWCTTYDPRQEIVYTTPEILPVASDSSQPHYYTIDGAYIGFDCPSDIAYTYDFRYKKGYDIASTSTNDILTNYPGVYLYGALVEAAVFARDRADLDIFETKFQTALEEAQIAESQNKANATLFGDSGSRNANIYNGGF